MAIANVSIMVRAEVLPDNFNQAVEEYIHSEYLRTGVKPTKEGVLTDIIHIGFDRWARGRGGEVLK